MNIYQFMFNQSIEIIKLLFLIALYIVLKIKKNVTFIWLIDIGPWHAPIIYRFVTIYLYLSGNISHKI